MTDVPTSTTERLRANLAHCRTEIEAAANRAGRRASEISLVTVTKYVDADAIRLLYELGLRAFGESRVQRLSSLSQQLEDLTDIEWHMIGHLQRNKVGRVLEVSRCLHSLDSERLTEEIGAQLSARRLPPPALYVEVNVAGDAKKTGLTEAELEPVLRLLKEDERFQSASGCASIQGLMTMAPFTADPEDARPVFRRLRALRDQYVAVGLLPVDSGLSMGMSRDFLVAIEEGATLVRIGSKLYEGTALTRR